MIQVEQVASLPGHQNPIYTVEASQKPGIIFTAGNDTGVVEWSLERNEFIKVLMPVKTSVYALHATPVAPLLAVGERNGDVSLFNFEEQQVSAVLHHHSKPIFDIKSVISKKELLVASEDGTVSVWDLSYNPGEVNQHKLLYSFKVGHATVRAISISPDEKTVAFGSKDHRISIYSLDDYSLLHDFEAHTLPVSSLQYSPDGKYLLSGSRDAQLNIWNTSGYSLYKTVPAHLFAIYSIVWHPDKPFFATASRDKTIKIWDANFDLLKTISINKGFPMHRLSVNKIVWEPNNGHLVSVSDDKLVMIWNITSV
ncbi:MAG TPA: WD40 repeat domain-containing protein [Daejeonella sp.]|nr:WD40 repeat domain-containing protein [Daejeonella sp.]